MCDPKIRFQVMLPARPRSANAALAGVLRLRDGDRRHWDVGKREKPLPINQTRRPIECYMAPRCPRRRTARHIEVVTLEIYRGRSATDTEMRLVRWRQ